MAHVLKLIDSSSNAITLTDNTAWMLQNYTPRTPRDSAGGVQGGIYAGENLSDVSETIELTVLGASKAIVQSNLNAVERMLYKASERQRLGGGDKVYLQLQVDADSEVYRSEILTGRVELADNALALWYNAQAEVRLFLTRRFYWEETGALTSVSMTSYVTTPAATTAAIAFNDPNTWVQIAAAQVEGSLPTPAKITVTKTDATTPYMKRLWALNNWHDEATTFDAYLAGTEADSGATYNGAGSDDTAAYRWDLSWEQQEDLKGRYTRILAFFSAQALTEGVMQVAVEQGITTKHYVMCRGPRIGVQSWGGASFDLGSVPLPPGGEFITPFNTHISLRLTSDDPTPGLTCDYVLLVPVSSEVMLEDTAVAPDEWLVGQNDSLVMDGTEGVAYYEASTVKSPLVVTRGGPLLLYPGRNQRIYFAWDNKNTPTNITANIQIAYRKRRKTI